MCKLGRVENFLFALTHILVQLHKKAFLLKEFRFLKHFKNFAKQVDLWSPLFGIL